MDWYIVFFLRAEKMTLTNESKAEKYFELNFYEFIEQRRKIELKQRYKY
jgi:hypothetical protein